MVMFVLQCPHVCWLAMIIRSVHSSCFCAPCSYRNTKNAGQDLLMDLISGNTGMALPGQPLAPILNKDDAMAALTLLEQQQEEAKKSWIYPRSYSLHEIPGMKFGACALANEPIYRVQPEVEPLLLDTFDAVVASHKLHGHTVQMNRYDLFHGHLFQTLSNNDKTSLGLLFHCAEYPAKDSNILAGIDLGACQIDSSCRPSLEQEWRYRNVLWLAWSNNNNNSIIMEQGMWLLDGMAPEIANLRMDGSEFGPQCPNAVWEGYLGTTLLADLYCLGDGKVWCSPTTTTTTTTTA